MSQAASEKDRQAPELAVRIEPQFGQPGAALRRHSADSRFILASGDLYDAASLHVVRSGAGDQFIRGGAAVRNGLVVRDLETWAIIDDLTGLFGDSYTWDLTLSEDGEHIAWYGHHAIPGEKNTIVLKRRADGATLYGAPNSLRAFDFSQDGKALWIWSYDAGHKSLLTIVEVRTGAVLHEWRLGRDGIGEVCERTANSGGRLVVHRYLEKLTCNDPAFHRCYIEVVDRDSLDVVATLCRPADADQCQQLMAWGERAACFSADGGLLAVLMARSREPGQPHVYEGSVIVWETSGWTEVRRIAIPNYDPWRQKTWLSFAPDGRGLQVGEEDYDLVTGRLMRSFANAIDKPLLAMAGDPTTSRLVRVHHDGVVAGWDLVGARQVAATKVMGRFLALSDDGTLIASLCENYFTDLPTDDPPAGYDHDDFEANFRWRAGRYADAIVIQDSATGAVTAELRTRWFEVKAYKAAFSPDNRALIATVTEMGAGIKDVFIGWDLETGQILWVRDFNAWFSQTITFSPDGKLFTAWHGKSESLPIVEVATGRQIWQIEPTRGQADGISQVLFDTGRPNVLIAREMYFQSPVEAFNLVTGQRTALTITRRGIVLDPRHQYVAWAGGVRRWGEETDLFQSFAADNMWGVDGLFRGDHFYGGFWDNRENFTRVIGYRLSDGEYSGVWDCGFPIEAVRVVDAAVAGRPASLIAISARKAKIWGDRLPEEGLTIEFLPNGGLITHGAEFLSWTEEATPHLRAYRGNTLVPLDAYVPTRTSDE